MYDRRIDGQTLTFGHEGMLYRNSFVMYDKGSESKWVHVTGEAIKGPMKGKRLPFLSSTIVPWSYWRLEHPDTKVLLGEQVEGMMGAFRLQDRLAGYGLSVGEGQAVTLFRYTMLHQMPVLESEVDGQALVLTFDREILLGRAFKAKLGGEKLDFDPILEEGEGQSTLIRRMRDAGTGSLWDIRTGRCVDGPLAGQRLESVPATAWLGKRWVSFFPKGKVVGLPKSD